MIRIDAIWIVADPMEIRAGAETALVRMVAVLVAAQPHCAYLFANRRANREIRYRRLKPIAGIRHHNS